MRVVALAAVLFPLAVSASWGSASPVSRTATITGGGHGSVSSISCAGPGECAAGGYYTDHGGKEQQAFVVSETTGRWGKAIKVPGTVKLNSGGTAEVDSISCAAAGECAAGGYYTDRGGNQQAFVVSETNGRWGKAIDVPGTVKLNRDGIAGVNTISCAGVGECAAGGYYTSDSTGTELFVVSETKGRWGKAIDVRGTAALNYQGIKLESISCAAVGACAAGGYYTSRVGNQVAFVVSETNGRWGKAITVAGATLNRGGDAEVSSISCAAPGECAAGGYSSDSSGALAFVVSETNGRWGKAIEAPGTAKLNRGGDAAVGSVSCAAAGVCAAGGYYTGSNDGRHAFVVTETNGRWGEAIKVRGGDVSPISCAAAGYCSAGGDAPVSAIGQRPVVVSQTNGSWGRVVQVRLPVSCLVPGVVGKSILGAKKRLGAADCAWKVTFAYANRPRESVLAQHPKPGTLVRTGTPTVSLTVSKGVKPKKTAWRGTVATLPADAATGKNRDVDISSISCASPGNCTAVGSYHRKGGGQEGVLLTERAGHWAAGVEAVTPANGASNPYVILRSVSCASAGNCTAVGSYEDAGIGYLSGLLLTERGGHWAPGVAAVLPAGGGDAEVYLRSVSCASSGNCAAVGGSDANGAEGVLLTEKAGQWASGVSFGHAADLNSVSCSSDGSCAAAGYEDYADGCRDGCPYANPLLLTNDGGEWAQATGVWQDGNSFLSSVSCAAAGDCSAIGYSFFSSGIDQGGGPASVLLTEKAGTWHKETVIPPKNAKSPYWGNYIDLSGISCAYRGDCVAIGDYAVGDYPDRPTLLTEEAGKWERGVKVALPGDANGPTAVLSAVSCASPGNCAAVGTYSDSLYTNGDGAGLLLTEIAGRWHVVKAPRPAESFFAVSCASPGNCGAVGGGGRNSDGAYGYGVLLDRIAKR